METGCLFDEHEVVLGSFAGGHIFPRRALPMQPRRAALANERLVDSRNGRSSDFADFNFSLKVGKYFKKLKSAEPDREGNSPRLRAKASSTTAFAPSLGLPAVGLFGL